MKKGTDKPYKSLNIFRVGKYNVHYHKQKSKITILSPYDLGKLTESDYYPGLHVLYIYHCIFEFLKPDSFDDNKVGDLIDTLTIAEINKSNHSYFQSI